MPTIDELDAMARIIYGIGWKDDPKREHVFLTNEKRAQVMQAAIALKQTEILEAIRGETRDIWIAIDAIANVTVA